MATNAQGFPYPVGTDKIVDGDNAIRAVADAMPMCLVTPTPTGGATIDATTKIVSFNALSKVSLDAVFRAGFTRYTVKVRLSAASATAELQMRFRAAAAEIVVASSMISVLIDSNGASLTTSKQTSDNGIIANSGANGGIFEIEFQTAYAVANPAQWMSRGYQTAGAYSRQVFGHIGGQAGKSIDGFALYPSSGTITGSLHIIGWRA